MQTHFPGSTTKTNHGRKKFKWAISNFSFFKSPMQFCQSYCSGDWNHTLKKGSSMSSAAERKDLWIKPESNDVNLHKLSKDRPLKRQHTVVPGSEGIRSLLWNKIVSKTPLLQVGHYVGHYVHKPSEFERHYRRIS